MNLCPHFRLVRHGAVRPRWTLEIATATEQRTWDVPRGPPLHPRERHLAIEASVSAEMPVLGACWDAGPCEIRCWTPRHIVAVLHGARIKGCFSLVQFRRPGRAQWLWVRVRGGARRAKAAAPAERLFVR